MTYMSIEIYITHMSKTYVTARHMQMMTYDCSKLMCVYVKIYRERKRERITFIYTYNLPLAGNCIYLICMSYYNSNYNV